MYKPVNWFLVNTSAPKCDNSLQHSEEHPRFQATPGGQAPHDQRFNPSAVIPNSATGVVSDGDLKLSATLVPRYQVEDIVNKQVVQNYRSGLCSAAG